MAFSLSKKKPKSPNKVVQKESCSIFKTLLRYMYKVPIAISLLLLIYIWSSSTTIISGKIVQLCISSRKLNNLYCLSAGTQPNFEIPINPLPENGTGDIPIISNALTTPMVEEGSRNINHSSSIYNNVNYLDYLEKNVPISPTVLDNNTIIDTPLVTFDNSTTFSPMVTFDNSTTTIIDSPIVTFDNSTTYNSNDNVGLKNDNQKNALELVREDSDPMFRDSVVVDNRINNGSGDPVKAVEDYLKVLRSWAPDSNNREARRGCKGKGIFVYDLPSKFNVDLVSQCRDMVPWMDFCKYFTNGGMGEPIPRLGNSWYQTHMYSLELIFHSRVSKHECRVYNESEATLFYVPFYGGLDILRWHFKNVSNDVKDSLGLDLIGWLGKKASWSRNSGRDHVFVLGKITWDFRRAVGNNEKISWGTSFLEHKKMQNPAKLLIERHPWHENDVGVPHPTYFHPSSDGDVMTWQTRVVSSERRHLVSFAGADRPSSPENIRSVLINQCRGGSEDDLRCKFLDCNVGPGCKSPEAVIELFMASEFCLQPPGDSPTRKSVFDSLVSGCIPVIFDPYTAYYQYPWHLPEDHGKYSVFVDQKEVREKKVNVVERLTKISKRERDDMRRFIVYELLPGLVYGHTDSHLENFQDAFSITLDSLLQRVNSL